MSPTTPVSEKTVVLPGRDGGVQLNSPLALGAWSFGDRLFWGTTPENDSREALQASIEGGVSLVDTAEVYGFPPGRSETLLGRFLRERAPSGPSTTDGTSVQLMTKFAPFPWRTAGLSADPWYALAFLSTSARRQQIRRSVRRALEASLRRLQRPQLEVYLQHWPSFAGDSDEPIWDALAEAYHDGLVRAVGVSNFAPRRFQKCLQYLERVHQVPLACNQVSWSLLQRAPETERARSDADDRTLLQMCRDSDTKLVAYSPLAQGLLTGRYREGDEPRGARAGYARALLPRLPPLLRELEAIGRERDKRIAAVAINYVLTAGEVTDARGDVQTMAIPLVGARNRQQAEANAQALGWRLTPEEMARLRRAAAQVGVTLPGIPIARESFDYGL